MSMNNFLALSSSFFGILFLCKSMIYILWSSQCKYYELWGKFLKRGNELPNYISNIFIPNFNMRRFHLFRIWTVTVYIEISSVLLFLYNILLYILWVLGGHHFYMNLCLSVCLSVLKFLLCNFVLIFLNCFWKFT